MKTYSDGEDFLQIFELTPRLWGMKQGERKVIEYYMEMLTLWQELDMSLEEDWECTSDNSFLGKGRKGMSF